MPHRLNVVILGLSITSSWGNGHATIYRGLVRELARRGHDVLFLERDKPWYAANRDLPAPAHGRTVLYRDVDELRLHHERAVREADLVIVGSYVPDGTEVGRWVVQTADCVTAFYDIDTPITLTKLQNGDYEYISPDLVRRYQLYLSFTGGPTLDRIERTFGAARARAMYCCVDQEHYRPDLCEMQWDLGYMGTYSDDRQAKLERLMLVPAQLWSPGSFVVAGPQYPEQVIWPKNVQRIEHLPPSEHRRFYNAQRFTLNLTRQDMVRSGYAPSVRLFEAAACGTPIITDWWPGLDQFFELGREILVAEDPDQVLRYLRDIPEHDRLEIGERGRQRVLREHTTARRAVELESYAMEVTQSRATA